MPDARAHRSWPEFRYHFPRTYLRAVEASVGDWIIYYEPRRTTGDLSSRGGRLAYFATARVAAVRPDPTMPDRFYAFVEAFLQFPRSVPFKDGDVYYESALRRTDGGTSKGAFGRAVRPISDSEYGLILSAASSELFAAAISSSALQGFADEPAVFERPMVERVTSWPFRDAAFSSAVRSAYDNTCAMTGLKIINGGGSCSRHGHATDQSRMEVATPRAIRTQAASPVSAIPPTNGLQGIAPRQRGFARLGVLRSRLGRAAIAYSLGQHHQTRGTAGQERISAQMKEGDARRTRV
jgi:hypothetical protein